MLNTAVGVVCALAALATGALTIACLAPGLIERWRASPQPFD